MVIVTWLYFFGTFGVKHILKDIKKFINNKNIITNIFRTQAYDSILCGYFALHCIGFIDFMFKGKNRTNFSNLFLLRDFEKNDEIILEYFLK